MDVASLIDSALKTPQGAGHIEKHETQPGFASSLVAYIQASAGTAEAIGGRTLAAIALRNLVRRHWGGGRTSSGSSVPMPDERASLRPALVALIEFETAAKIYKQLTIAAARVARIDFPNEWPQAISSILTRIQSIISELSSTGTGSDGESPAGPLARLHRLVRLLHAAV